MKILVTGAAGSIGSELVRQLAKDNEVYALDHNETELFILYEGQKSTNPIKTRIGDIRDRETVNDTFESFRPDIVFHASALKHVTPAEHDPLEYVKTNIVGTSNVIRAAKRAGVRAFVNISTDKVVNAECIMGLTKKIAEKIVKNAGYVSVRFGNVIGSRGSVVPLWQAQLDAGKNLTVTDPRMTRFVMTIQQAVSLVITASEIGQPGEVVILDMGEPVNVLELAKEIISKSGRDLGIDIIGIRPGEMLSERLMTDEEERISQRRDIFTIIPNQ